MVLLDQRLVMLIMKDAANNAINYRRRAFQSHSPGGVLRPWQLCECSSSSLL